MAVQKHNTYYDNELYYYDENGERKPLQVGKVYSAGSGIKIENDIISVSGKYVASADPSLDGKKLVLKDNKWEELILPPSSDWLPTIKEASANAVSTVEGKFGLDEYNQITSYNNTPFANDKYHAGYGLDLDSSTNTFSAKKGFFALSADVYNKDEIDGKIETLEKELVKLGFYVCKPNEIDNNGVPNATVLDSEGKLSTSKVYLVKVATAPTPDQYKEWIWDGSEWTCIGDTTINLDGYATEDWVKGNFLSANALDLIASVSSQWNDVSSKLNTSAFNAWSVQADITPYTGIDPIKVDDHKISLTADYLSANALDDIKVASANWNNVYEIVSSTSSVVWNEVSAKADKTDLDELSAKVITLSGELETTSAYLNENIESLSGELKITSSFLSGAIDDVSAEFEKVVYTSATNGWDISSYSAGQNIGINNHTISSRDWTDEIKEASANAVDVVKSKFNKTQNGELSGYDNTPFYVVNQNTISGTSPILVTKQGDEYNIEFEQEYKRFIEEVSAKLYTSALPTVSSLTPDYLKVDFVEKEDGTSAWRLSAAEQKNYQPGDYIDIDENDKINVTGLHNVTLSSTNESISISATTGENGDVNFNLSANIPTIPGISGINGLSGYYNSDTNDYIIGVNNSGMTYYRGIATSLSNDNKALFNPIQSENITYNNGVFTIPSTVAKVTLSINEKIENNILTTNNVANHDFNLNKIALYCNDSEVISTQEYYHNELGVSELSLTYTIDNSNLGSNDYSIRYDGATLTGDFECNLSIIEEVLSFGTGGGTASATYHNRPNNLVHVDNTNFEIYAEDLSGLSPIFVQDKKNIGLNYDELQFDLSGGKLQINIQTSGGNIDQEAFEKLANIVYGRMTETIPIGLVNSYETLGDGGAFSYLFRPTMEFDVSHNTKARIMTHNCTINVSKAQVAISELNENNAYTTIMWWSEIKTLTATAGTVTLTANQGCTETRTLYPDRLYYATVINRDQQTQYVGFENKFLDDAGAYDIAYWAEHSTNGFARNLPYSLNGIPASNLGQTGGAKLKPYIAFRNEV